MRVRQAVSAMTIMRRFCSAMVVAALGATVGAGAAGAQTAAAQADDRTYTTVAQGQFDQIFGTLLKTAEKVGEDLYSFKPTPEVRSLGGMLGHAADGNVLLCGIAAGKGVKFAPVNEKKTTKADIIAGLKESKAVCDAVFAGLTDTSGKEVVKGFLPTPLPKLSWLHLNTSHAWEHYGNLVTYMRLKGITPPTSEK